MKEVEATITLGMDAEAFLQSNVGRYVKRRADEEVAAALESMKTVDPDDAKSIRALQMVIGIAEATIAWLQEAVEDGRGAAETLQGQDQ